VADLDRFKRAQEDRHAGFAAALREIQGGGKQGHWIWYIFPQLAGLGRSSASREYAIADEEEAIAFLRDPVLSERLMTITEAVAAQLAAGASITQVMGSAIDATKVVSSLTLFKIVAERIGSDRLARAADEVLLAAQSQGYSACDFTRRSI
jgi:uncharacterized protein (DUF1810 family)